jgi:3'(2'), 5'-bisphosphate nucleotidase
VTAADRGRYLRAAREAALAGAREILDVYRKPFRVERKEDSTPVTEADRRSQAAILDVLLRAFPAVPAMSEEAAQVGYEVRSSWPVYWLVDPLDGTKEFVARRGEFTVNIALMAGSYPCLGVVHVPVDGTLYIGSEDGAFRAVGEAGLGEAVRLPVDREAADHVRAAVSRSHLTDTTKEYLAALEARGRPVRSVAAGSARKLCLVAEGTADVYPRFGATMEWDTAAGQAVVEAAGGLLVDATTGSRLSYNKTDLRNPGFVALAPGRDPGYFLHDLPSRPHRGSGS